MVGNQIREQGAVGVLLQGPVGVRSIVSQGCRPIGKHFVITKARQLLGWSPQFDMRSGTQALINWYLAERSWASEVLTS